MKIVKKVFVLCSILFFGNQVIAQTEDESDADYKAYSNFDFIAGEKTIFYDDFAGKLTKWKVVEFDQSEEVESPGVRKIGGIQGDWFKLPRRGVFYPLNIKTLPENFTIEFDMWADAQKMSEMESGLILSIVGEKVNKSEYSTAFDENPQIQLDIHPSLELLYCTATKENFDGERVLARKEIKNGWKEAKVHRISITRKKTAVCVYVDEKKFIDLPNALPQSVKYTLVLATNMWGDGLFVNNFKLAEIIQAAPLKLDEQTKFVTSAIYFNVNSAVVKPESWPALRQAAALIKTVNGKVQITGHTDADGNDSENLLLSKKRAEAVKNILVQNFNLSAANLVCDGKGESVPIDSNTTAEGKANNRRVEFEKIK